MTYQLRHHGGTQAMKRHKTRYPGIYFRVAANGERRYQISYKDSAGRRIFDTVDGNERDAVRQRNQILERMHKGERVVKSNLTLKELGEDYFRTQTGHLKESTKGAYGYSFDHWIVPHLGNRKVAEIGVDDIADFIATMRQEHAAWTIRGCLTPLSRMFQYAIRRGYMSHNPVMALDKQERPRGSAKQMRILHTEEIGELLRTCDERWRPLFLTAIFSGLRISELINLRWRDVDFAEGKIKVVASKTDAGVREVVIPDFLVKELARLSLGRDGKTNVFSTLDGKILERRNVNRVLTNALQNAGLEHARFHDLRHTFASILISQGCDVTYVAQQMGHSSPVVTLGLYAKVFDPESRKKEARERMDASFGAMARSMAHPQERAE